MLITGTNVEKQYINKIQQTQMFFQFLKVFSQFAILTLTIQFQNKIEHFFRFHTIYLRDLFIFNFRLPKIGFNNNYH